MIGVWRSPPRRPAASSAACTAPFASLRKRGRVVAEMSNHYFHASSHLPVHRGRATRLRRAAVDIFGIARFRGSVRLRLANRKGRACLAHSNNGDTNVRLAGKGASSRQSALPQKEALSGSLVNDRPSTRADVQNRKSSTTLRRYRSGCSRSWPTAEIPAEGRKKPKWLAKLNSGWRACPRLEIFRRNPSPLVAK